MGFFKRKDRQAGAPPPLPHDKVDEDGDDLAPGPEYEDNDGQGILLSQYARWFLVGEVIKVRWNYKDIELEQVTFLESCGAKLDKALSVDASEEKLATEFLALLKQLLRIFLQSTEEGSAFKTEHKDIAYAGLSALTKYLKDWAFSLGKIETKDAKAWRDIEGDAALEGEKDRLSLNDRLRCLIRFLDDYRTECKKSPVPSHVDLAKLEQERLNALTVERVEGRLKP